MTLDVMSPNGMVWEQMWSSEDPTMAMCTENCWSPAWIESHGDYKTFNVRVDEWGFINELQVQRKSAQTTYDLSYRLAFKNGKGEAIDALTQEFTLTIDASALASTNECADATVKAEYAEKAGDVSLAFKQYETLELQDLEVPSAYKVKPQLPKADGTLADAGDKCQVKYQLNIYHQDS
jgi:hypothetical protein